METRSDSTLGLNAMMPRALVSDWWLDVNLDVLAQIYDKSSAT